MNQQCNVENMTKWIEALESGKYPQDPNGGYLRTERGFCCLGVLEDVAGTEWEQPAGPGTRFETPRGEYAMPNPSRVHGFLGIPQTKVWESDTVSVFDTEDGIHRGVHGLNDEGRSFVQIAALLRREFSIPKAP